MTGKLIEQYELLLTHQIGFVKYLDILQMAIKEFPDKANSKYWKEYGGMVGNLFLVQKYIDDINIWRKKWLIGDEDES